MERTLCRGVEVGFGWDGGGGGSWKKKKGGARRFVLWIVGRGAGVNVLNGSSEVDVPDCFVGFQLLNSLIHLAMLLWMYMCHSVS